MVEKVALTLMAVHAHPDDEAIGTGGILAKYASEGIRTVLVTCTKGELGDVLNPSYVPPRPGMSITEIREEELAQAMKILRVSAYHNLGYKDSGMAGTSGNMDPKAFAQADVTAATHRLVRLIRKERPQVVVTYDENGIYGHPDHVMAHRVTQKAFTAANDSDLILDTSEPPWQPRKLYHLAIPMERLKRFRKAGEDDQSTERPTSSIVGTPEEQITTRIDITPVIEQKFEAIFSHKSQIGSGHLFRQLSQAQRVALFGKEHFVCVHGCNLAANEKERDLFEGLR